jgi:hypothetical protein
MPHSAHSVTDLENCCVVPNARYLTTRPGLGKLNTYRARTHDVTDDSTTFPAMTFEEFCKHVDDSKEPSADLSETLKALWYAKKGNWKKAHELAQDISSEDGSWIHANLHREEGDLENARYWYDRAGRPVSSLSVDDERDELIRTFLRPA